MTNSNILVTNLVTRYVDRNDLLEPKVPLKVRHNKGCHKSTF